MFEQRMNPFTAFHRNQRKLHHSRLSTAEKITLNSIQLFTATKFGRNFVFFYALCLHALGS